MPNRLGILLNLDSGQIDPKTVLEPSWIGPEVGLEHVRQEMNGCLRLHMLGQQEIQGFPVSVEDLFGLVASGLFQIVDQNQTPLGPRLPGLMLIAKPIPGFLSQLFVKPRHSSKRVTRQPLCFDLFPGSELADALPNLNRAEASFEERPEQTRQCPFFGLAGDDEPELEIDHRQPTA